MEWLNQILYNQEISMWVMAVIVALLTEVLKLPIKACTKTLDKTARERVNALIILLAVGIGMFIYYLYCTHIAHIEFQYVNGASIGGLASVAYDALMRLIGKNGSNPFKTEGGEEMLNAIEKASADGEISEDEKKEIQAYVDGIDVK